MGVPATDEGLAAAGRENAERETLLRKQELEDLIFKSSDLLTAAPKDFPDLQPMEQIIAAAAKLNDPYRKHRPGQLRAVITPLADALAVLQAELARLEGTEQSE